MEEKSSWVPQTSADDVESFGFIELSSTDFSKLKESHSNLELVPVTADLKTEHIEGDRRLSVWQKRREEKVIELGKQLKNGILTPQQIESDGWVQMWMKYFRIAFDKENIQFYYVNRKGERSKKQVRRRPAPKRVEQRYNSRHDDFDIIY